MSPHTLLLLVILSLLPGLTFSQPKFEITQIAQNVYQHTSFRDFKPYGKVSSNGLIIIDNQQAYIIDTPWSEGETWQLLHWLKQQQYTPAASLSTHFHDDRTAGISLLNSLGIPTYTSDHTDQLLEQAGKSRATSTFNQREFWLLKRKIQAFFPGAGHAPDNWVVWLPEQQILFGGCLLRSQGWSSLGNLQDAKINQWGQSLKELKHRYPVIKQLVPGHGKIGTAQLIDHTLDLVETHQNKQGLKPAH